VARKPRLRVRGVRFGALAGVREARGRLVAAQAGAPLPFAPRRCFVIMDVPSTKIRGEHAHKKLKQFLVCVRGRVKVLVDDGRARQTVVLDDAGTGLYVPPMVWAAQYDYSKDAVLVVFASAGYDARDYIRDYGEFLERVRRARKK
jgi:UDP-2-acetamido-3-amino-2,3-dideoxy-glucuronate N-acetyltransferase